MRLKVLKRDEKHLELAVGGEGHTLLNLLQSSLLRDEEVRMAGYTQPHPLMDYSILFIETKGEKTPEQAIIDATERVKGDLREFLSAFKKEMEGEGEGDGGNKA
jgi:DNA-directed RNA polymerase subunit L